MSVSPKWNSLEESEYEEESEEENEESKRCRMICNAVGCLLLLLWCIGLGWSISVIVPAARLSSEASGLSSEDDFVKSDGGCLILDVQHSPSGECGWTSCPDPGCTRFPECRCEDLYSYTFKDTEGSTLTSSKEVKFTSTSPRAGPCKGHEIADIEISLTGGSDCARTCEEESKKCNEGIQLDYCTKKASTYKIGKNVTCWKPRFAETQSRTVGTEGVRAYECANAKCVKIFDPAQDLENHIMQWTEGGAALAIVFLVLCVVCPCLLALPGAIESIFCKGRRE